MSLTFICISVAILIFSFISIVGFVVTPRNKRTNFYKLFLLALVIFIPMLVIGVFVFGLLAFLFLPSLSAKHRLHSLDHPNRVELIEEKNSSNNGGSGSCDSNYYHTHKYETELSAEEIKEFYEKQFFSKGLKAVNAEVYLDKHEHSGYRLIIEAGSYTLTAGEGGCPWPQGG